MSVCAAGVCFGMTRDECRKYITETSGADYFAGWVNRVPWIAGNVCKSGICCGLSLHEAKELITQKHGADYFQGWIFRVEWGGNAAGDAAAAPRPPADSAFRRKGDRSSALPRPGRRTRKSSELCPPPQECRCRRCRSPRSARK